MIRVGDTVHVRYLDGLEKTLVVTKISGDCYYGTDAGGYEWVSHKDTIVDTVPDKAHTFDTGAVRGSNIAKDRPYHLISPIALRCLAEAYGDGIKRGYAPNNWQKGMPMSDILCHAIEHIYKYIGGDTTENHLSHALWNIATACHFHETRPDLNDVLSLPKNPPAPAEPPEGT